MSVIDIFNIVYRMNNEQKETWLRIFSQALLSDTTMNEFYSWLRGRKRFLKKGEIDTAISPLDIFLIYEKIIEKENKKRYMLNTSSCV
jgi:hypothetical protein